MKKILYAFIAVVIMVVSASMLLITVEQEQPETTPTPIINNSVGLMDVTVDEGI